MSALLGLASGCSQDGDSAARATPADTSIAQAAAPSDARIVGVWQPPAGLRQIPIWPGHAPDQAGVEQPPESHDSSVNPNRFEGRPVTGVFDVSTPTITVFPAKRPGNGAAILCFRAAASRCSRSISKAPGRATG